jgi:gliding motility-associated-like protein
MKVTTIFSTIFISILSLSMSAQVNSSGETITGEEVNVYIPNAFTPNGDGLNDVFKPIIDAPELKLYEFIIMDRVGGEAFYSTDPTEVWNGSIKGNDYTTSPSVFVYFLKIQTVNGLKPLTYTGHVVLIR